MRDNFTFFKSMIRNSKFVILNLLFIQLFVFAPSCSWAKDNSIIINSAPFTPQAPFGSWKDQRFQDGCEEASVLIAFRWAKNLGLTKKEAETEILKMADWETNKYKNYRDTSAADTAKRLLGEFYGYKNYQVKSDIKASDIISEIQKGNIVIVPTNGQKLKNPYFTQPGPDRHMLVIIGYDSTKKEFIVNDPGTRRGQNYRYNEKILFNAIRDYPTGNHLKIVGEKKSMIVVGKIFK